MSIVFLIGMPGVGKSHWGRIWSRAHNFEHRDLDEVIEQTTGRSIPAIIESQGESGFREIESEVLAQTIGAVNGRATIVSCGGGTPTIAGNLRLMRRSGCIVYLEAGPETLLRQLNASVVPRPLLKEITESRLAEVLERRKEFYEQADIRVAVSNAEAGTFAQILKACINRHS